MPQSTESKLSREALKATLPGDFPLSLHPNGQFSKKYHGRVYYFGKLVLGWEKALKRFHAEWDEITSQGARPKQYAEAEPQYDDFTIRDAANHFLTAKTQLVESGELSQRSVVDYKATCAKVIKEFGLDYPVAKLKADDFQRLRVTLSQGRGAVSLGNNIVRVRMIFKFCYDQGYIAKLIRYGQTFTKPNAKARRKARNEKMRVHGKRMLEADQLRKVIDAASLPLKAMALLAANCGFGQSDLSSLRLPHLDLEGGGVISLDPKPKLIEGANFGMRQSRLSGSGYPKTRNPRIQTTTI